MPKPEQLFDVLRQFVDEVDREKRATDGVGETSHPSADVDGGNQEASTGARASENEDDVKDAIPNASVDAAPDPASEASTQADLQPNIGPQQSATGGDPAVEDDYKATKDDPGTTHPAKADDGEKYASMSFDQLSAQFAKLANALLADVAVDAAAPPAADPADRSRKAAAAGYAAAAGAADSPDALSRARCTIEDTIKEANHAADLVAQYLPELYERMRKEADEGDDRPADKDPAAPDDRGGGPGPSPGPDAPPDDRGDAPAAPGGEEMLSQLLGAEDQPPSHDEAMEGMNGAMDDMQISPEVLQQIIALLEQAGHGGQPAAMKQARLLTKAAASARKYRRDGKYEVGPAKTARARAIRNEMRSYLSEILASVQQ